MSYATIPGNYYTECSSKCTFFRFIQKTNKLLNNLFNLTKV
ncbi:hypothetical protein EDC17_102334 [Sphingobacterium alimentarium]|uniref:Uncharacterized protein n=1 Tax=Sphingobacterium alimentarium TaxID=797292 RepID=A0A4R3VX22_9SPHI|nr:hypothetical protein EDC17_102334 [Sphingobacterium alimentarium]